MESAHVNILFPLKEVVPSNNNTTPPLTRRELIQLLVSGPGVLVGLAAPAPGRPDAPGPVLPGLFQGPQGLCHAVTT